MNGLQIYLLGCLLAYPIAIYFLNIYDKANNGKTLITEMQKKVEQIKSSVNPNFIRNWLIGFAVLLSWVIVIFWLYLKLNLLYHIIKYHLFKK